MADEMPRVHCGGRRLVAEIAEKGITVEMPDGAKIVVRFNLYEECASVSIAVREGYVIDTVAMVEYTRDTKTYEVTTWRLDEEEPCAEFNPAAKTLMALE